MPSCGHGSCSSVVLSSSLDFSSSISLSAMPFAASAKVGEMLAQAHPSLAVHRTSLVPKVRSLSDLENEGFQGRIFTEKGAFGGENPSVDAFIPLSPTDS